MCDHFGTLCIKGLEVLTILAKILILDAWLDPEDASAEQYVIVLKIQTKICKKGTQVKMESF